MIVHQKSFPPQRNKHDIPPALLITSSEFTGGKQLIKITGPGFSLVGQKHIYFLHRLSWHISLFQKCRGGGWLYQAEFKGASNCKSVWLEVTACI